MHVRYGSSRVLAKSFGYALLTYVFIYHRYQDAFARRGEFGVSLEQMGTIYIVRDIDTNLHK